MTVHPPPGLRRFLTPRPPAAERCELCGVPVDDRHRHLVDTERRALACACTGCALLFDRAGAGAGRFATIPDRYLTDPAHPVAGATWQALGIPVGVAFLFRNSARQRVVALYPSPAGATENEIDPATWETVTRDLPLARALAPDTEALLVRHTDSATSCHLVPIDAAYELVGRLRLHWQGFDGGGTARAELDAFFTTVHRKAVTLPATPATAGGDRP